MTDPLRESPTATMSVDEYLAFEESSDVRHEYVEGAVYAMSGPTSRHEQIVANVVGHLWNAARRGPCRAYASNLKLRVPTDRIYYPDAMTICTAGDDDVLVAEDPCVIVEVTSPSSLRTDRHEKRDAYLQIASLRSYLVVDQRRRQVGHWSRDEGGAWRHDVLIEQGTLDVPCPALTLSLDDIYEGIVLPPADARRVREPEPAFE